MWQTHKDHKNLEVGTLVYSDNSTLHLGWYIRDKNTKNGLSFHGRLTLEGFKPDCIEYHTKVTETLDYSVDYCPVTEGLCKADSIRSGAVIFCSSATLNAFGIPTQEAIIAELVDRMKRLYSGVDYNG